MGQRRSQVQGRLANAVGSALARLPISELRAPVFVVGTGRSGTTALGTALSHHPDVTYLNEPHRLWFSHFPQTDVWTRRAPVRHGRIVLEAQHADASRSRQLRRRFQLETAWRRRPVLVEKLPINAFRVGFLTTVFTEARFVYLTRHPVEVAASIERMGAGWWGVEDFKWKQLEQLARDRVDATALTDAARDNFRRGLVEWRLSNEEIQRHLATLPTSQVLHVRYDDFVDDPEAVVARTLEFLGLAPSATVAAFVRQSIARRSASKGSSPPTRVEQPLIGDLTLVIGPAT